MTPAASLVALHVAVALFGFAGLFGKWLPWDPVAIAFGRTVVAAGVLAIIAAWKRDERSGPTLSLAANGALLAVHWVAFFAAIEASTVAIGLLGFGSFPLFVLMLERMVLGVRWHAREALIAALVVVGLALPVRAFSLDDNTVRGLAWGVLSGFTFAWLAVRNRQMRSQLSRTSGADRPAVAIALWQNAFAALCLAPWVLRPHGPVVTLTPATLMLILLLGAVCTALAHSLFIASLRRVSAHTASVVTALESVYGIALAAWLLAEVPSLRTCLGAILLVAAAVVASRRASRAAIR